MAQTQRDTLNAEMQIAKSNIQDVGIAIGGDLIPMVSTLTGYISTGADRFQDLNGDQRRAIILPRRCRRNRPCPARRRDTADDAPGDSDWVGMATGAASGFAASLTGELSPRHWRPTWLSDRLPSPCGRSSRPSGQPSPSATGSTARGRATSTESETRSPTHWGRSKAGSMLHRVDATPSRAARSAVLRLAENLFGIQDIVGSVFDWIGDKIGWLIDKIESIPGIGEKIDGEANVDSNMPDAPEEPSRSPVTARGNAAAESDLLPALDIVAPTPEEAASTAMSSTSWAPSADLVAGASTSASPSAGSAGMSTQEFKTALREVLEGLRLETRLETDQRGSNSGSKTSPTPRSLRQEVRGRDHAHLRH